MRVKRRPAIAFDWNLKAGICLLVFLSVQRLAPAQAVTDIDCARRAELIRQRADWLRQRIAYPLSHIPADARWKAVQEANALSVASPTSHWTLIGPRPITNGFYPISGTVPAL